MPQHKTPEYTRRASKNYRERHSYMNIVFDKGEPDLFREVGLDTATIREMIRAEYQKRLAEKE